MQLSAKECAGKCSGCMSQCLATFGQGDKGSCKRFCANTGGDASLAPLKCEDQKGSEAFCAKMVRSKGIDCNNLKYIPGVNVGWGVRCRKSCGTCLNLAEKGIPVSAQNKIGPVTAHLVEHTPHVENLVIKATYGQDTTTTETDEEDYGNNKDVRQLLFDQLYTKSNKSFKVTNKSMGGDPWPGHPKKLVVLVKNGENSVLNVFPEGATIPLDMVRGQLATLGVTREVFKNAIDS